MDDDMDDDSTHSDEYTEKDTLHITGIEANILLNRL